jgi:hypothetical protein
MLNGFLEELTGDVSYAIRGLARSPGFTAAAVITLALGIGAATAVFSVVNSVLLEPLLYHDSDRLVRIVQRAAPANPSAPLWGDRRSISWSTTYGAACGRFELSVARELWSANRVRSGHSSAVTSGQEGQAVRRPTIRRRAWLS